MASLFSNDFVLYLLIDESFFLGNPERNVILAGDSMIFLRNLVGGFNPFEKY